MVKHFGPNLIDYFQYTHILRKILEENFFFSEQYQVNTTKTLNRKLDNLMNFLCISTTISPQRSLTT